MINIGNAHHSHFGELAVHFLIVDDLTQQENAAVSKDFAGGVGKIDGAFHAVAEAKVPGQTHRGGSNLNHAAFGADLFNNAAAVMRLHLGLHALHHLRGANIHTTGGWSRCRHERGVQITQ